MAVYRPRSEDLFVRPRKTLDPLVEVREDPVANVAESDMSLVVEEHRQSCLTAS